MAHYFKKFHIYSRHLSSAAIEPWHLRPNYLAPNATLKVTLSQDAVAASFRIIGSFQPFTQSACLLVAPAFPQSGFPGRLVCKLADRRLGKYRYKSWDIKAETAFQRGLKRYILRHGCAPEPAGYAHSTTNPVWRQELNHWDMWEQQHHAERRAYEHLKDAQKLGLIPRFLGPVEIDMRNNDSGSSGLSHPALDCIKGLLLEYIPGRRMSSFSPGIDISLEEAESVSQKVIALGRGLRRYGVTHMDIHTRNIILRAPHNNPVLIDWGRASLTGVDRPLEERYNDTGVQMDFLHDIRSILEKTDDEAYDGREGKMWPWHRLSTPLSDEFWIRRASSDNHGIFSWINKNIEELPKDVRDSQYNEDESVNPKEGLRWKIKEGVKSREIDE